MAQTTETQIGPAAIAPPASMTTNKLPIPTPQLHHLEKHNDEDELAFDELPPFPGNVPTAPLLRLNLNRLLQGNPQEIEKLWNACRDIGFFYLDLRDGQARKRDSFQESETDGHDEAAVVSTQLDGNALLEDAAQLFSLGEKVFMLPTEEKQEYDFKDRGSYFGYKGLGAGVIDSKGTKDRNEFYNVSKDDLLGIGEPLPAPAVLKQDDSRKLLESYMRRSHAVVSLILSLLNGKLGLPTGTLENLHRLDAVSGDQVRWVRSPPQIMDDRQMSLGEHTDFGSITILFNRLGGLQVLPPGSEEWCYVKPLKGHCIVNLGDAMVKFTAGILRSNIHRVVSPPLGQEHMTRMSLVYFARPEDDIVLKALEESELIKTKREDQRREGRDDEEITAKDWILRRALGRRVGGDYATSGGTEAGRSKQF
ncbi:Clavaminate synthase-like protein [Hortaea werneckii]|uniref:Fe2OG dioxygenase domain-containing protein n=1 Tax=Hortaea werneckii TaxID=91943 RepID=A0A3M7BTG7_HORWE|nr:Clavaminate synthase-like protein [Hortaea werneckii]KAI7543631.1 Clavaminate synthase-like protein [Hortaea werneckii]KAI7590722.1 Clavaminate synthase-like protein [Hortaea werneckii]KAI7617800.1 Clavaminate synthase-like protein [Hortaea werneckii]KAI7631564.1 Clavaminate synthase-like protein [Hortaea werneckii]